MSKDKNPDWSKVNWNRRFYDRLKAMEPKLREKLGQVVKPMQHRVEEFAQALDELASQIEAMSFEDYMEALKSKEGRAKHAYLDAWKKLEREIHEASLPRIAIEDCIHGHVYRLHSRNLSVGAWHSEQVGFSGIREKFGRRYIFMEYHWDHTSFPTARPLEDLGPLPEGILPDDGFPPVDKETRRPVWFDREAKDDEHKAGRWMFSDTKEYSDDIHPVGEPNTPLFKYLEPLDEKYRAEEKAEWDAHEAKLKEKKA